MTDELLDEKFYQQFISYPAIQALGMAFLEIRLQYFVLDEYLKKCLGDLNFETVITEPSGKNNKELKVSSYQRFNPISFSVRDHIFNKYRDELDLLIQRNKEVYEITNELKQNIKEFEPKLFAKNFTTSEDIRDFLLDFLDNLTILSQRFLPVVSEIKNNSPEFLYLYFDIGWSSTRWGNFRSTAKALKDEKNRSRFVGQVLGIKTNFDSIDRELDNLIGEFFAQFTSTDYWPSDVSPLKKKEFNKHIIYFILQTLKGITTDIRDACSEIMEPLIEFKNKWLPSLNKILELIHGRKETDLIENFLVPLLAKMGFTELDIKHPQGVSEKGRDIICVNPNEKPGKFIGFVVTADELSENVRKSGWIDKIWGQINRSLIHEYRTKSNESVRLDSVIVVAAGGIVRTGDPREFLFTKMKDNFPSKGLIIWDDYDFTLRLMKLMPEILNLTRRK